MSNKTYKMYKLVVLAVIAVAEAQNCSDTYKTHRRQEVFYCQYNDPINITNSENIRQFSSTAASTIVEVKTILDFNLKAFIFNPNVSFI